MTIRRLSLRLDFPHPGRRTAGPRRQAHEPPARLLASAGRELEIAATGREALRCGPTGFHPPQSYQSVVSDPPVKLPARWGGETMSVLSVNRRSVTPVNDAHRVINRSYRDPHRLADG